MRFFERKFFYAVAKPSTRRALAIITTYLIAVLLFVLLLRLVIPQLIESITAFVGNTNTYLSNLNSLLDWIGASLDFEPERMDQFRLSSADVLNRVIEAAREFTPQILDMSIQIGSGLISGLTAIISSIYMLSGKDVIFRQIRRFFYAFVPRRSVDYMTRVIKLSTEVFTGFISGKLIDSAIIGAICFVGLYVIDSFAIDMPFYPLISVIVAVTNIIPFFGPFIGAIPSALILLIVNPISAIWFVVFILVLQQFDGNILGPKILGNTVGLPPLWILAAIVIGGGLFGFTGMVAGVPAVAVIYTLVREIVSNRLKNRGFNDEATGLALGEIDMDTEQRLQDGEN
jgi:predicted PurR-regulated permease PerM